MTKKKPGERRALIPAAVGQDKTALVPNNPRVANIAFRLRWNAETVVRRTASALPAPVEQQLYLRVAGGFRIQPESLAKMLRVFRGDQELCEADMETKNVGKNLVMNRFDEIVEKCVTALSMLDKAGDEAEYPASMENIAHLVELYGEYAAEVLGELVENVGAVKDALGLKSDSDRLIVGVAIATLVKRAREQDDGTPLPLTIDEMFRDRWEGVYRE